MKKKGKCGWEGEDEKKRSKLRRKRQIRWSDEVEEKEYEEKYRGK